MNKFFDKDFDKYTIIIVSTIYNPSVERFNVNEGLKKFSIVKNYKFINIYEDRYSILKYKTDNYHYSINGYEVLSKYIINNI